jgi:hypothetical protein
VAPEGYLLWGRACELNPPLTHPLVFGVSFAGVGGRLGAAPWKCLLTTAKSLFARAGLG